MKFSSIPVRGTRDIMPQEMVVRDYVEKIVLETYRRHGFQRVETPILENIDLLMGSEGGENLKMLFTILKRGEKLNILNSNNLKDLCDMGLRYDLTLPLSRFYSNNKSNLEMPFKAIQIGNVFRAERPQKGRFRSFKQCDIDIIGESSEIAEIELIDTTSKALNKLNFKDFKIRINDRRILNQIILSCGFRDEDIPLVCIILDKLDKIGDAGVENELVAKGYDGKSVNSLIEMINNINESNLTKVNVESHIVEELIRVIKSIRTLSKGSYKIDFDPTLVRGMGYYTGQIFEISYGSYGFAIAGGGRYDNMIGKYTKDSTSAVGFSIGFERIVHIILEEVKLKDNNIEKVAFMHHKNEDMTLIINKANELRKRYCVTLIPIKKKLSKQLSQLKQQNYKYFMIYGKDTDIKEFSEDK